MVKKLELVEKALRPAFAGLPLRSRFHKSLPDRIQPYLQARQHNKGGEFQKMEWPRLLAYITGRVDKELLVRNEYLAAENRILRAKIRGRLQLLDGEKRSLAEIAHRLGRKAVQ